MPVVSPESIVFLAIRGSIKEGRASYGLGITEAAQPPWCFVMIMPKQKHS